MPDAVGAGEYTKSHMNRHLWYGDRLEEESTWSGLNEFGGHALNFGL